MSKPEEGLLLLRSAAARMQAMGAWRWLLAPQSNSAWAETLLGSQAMGMDPQLGELLALLPLHEPLVAPDVGAAAWRIGEGVVIECLTAVAGGREGLAQAGVCSAMAFAVVDAALALGGNVACTGPIAACLPVMAAWVDAGQRPAAYASVVARPSRWFSCADADAATAWDADRVALWHAPMAQIPPLLAQLHGAVAHIGGHRLERALMRFERAESAAAAPLSVLAALDMVVVASRDARGVPRVDAIYEILLDAQGYRPQALFSRGQGASPQALTPLAQPSFALQLPRLGRAELAAELQAAHSTLPEQSMPAAEPVPAPSALARRSKPASHARAGSASSMARAIREHAQSLPPSRPLAAPTELQLSPGWELEQDDAASEQSPEQPPALAEAAVASFAAPALTAPPAAADAAEPLSNDAAADDDALALAATFGLAPPPKPPGERDASADLSFADFLPANKADKDA